MAKGKMKITLDELRDKNNPINESFNLLEKEVRKVTNGESEVEKLLTERVVSMFVTSFRNNKEKFVEEEEFAKQKVEVGIKRCMVVEENEDEKNTKLQPKKIKRETKSKNNNAKLGFERAPTMPNNFRERIKGLGGKYEKLVIEKKIYSTDLSSSHNRFSIPLCQIRDHEFLTTEEQRKLDENKGKIDVLLIEPCMEESMQHLKKWNMNSSETYVLTHKWNDVVSRNKEILKKDEMVQLWSFRVESKVCFALIKIGDHGASISRNRDLTATSSGSSSSTTEELLGL